MALEGIKSLLAHGVDIANQQNSEINPFLEILETDGGVQKIESLQTHANNEVYQKAFAILENFFET